MGHCHARRLGLQQRELMAVMGEKESGQWQQSPYTRRYGKTRIYPEAVLTTFSRVGCGLEYDGNLMRCKILHVLVPIQADLGR